MKEPTPQDKVRLQSYFGFSKIPFHKYMWAKHMFESAGQMELLGGLNMFLDYRGICLVSGPPGVGKSITLRRLKEELNENHSWCSAGGIIGTHFSLPSSKGSLETDAEAMEMQPSEKKILVVDDEPFILKSLTFVLKKEGFQVSSATNGVEAMERIQQEKPDIVFLDIMMPKMNGLEVCQWIRQDAVLSSIYVIILTAKGQEADREKGLKIGADEYMTKPFSPSQVVKRTKEIFEERA